MDTYILYGISIIFLGISFFKDKKKTKIALKKAWKAFGEYVAAVLHREPDRLYTCGAEI